MEGQGNTPQPNIDLTAFISNTDITPTNDPINVVTTTEPAPINTAQPAEPTSNVSDIDNIINTLSSTSIENEDDKTLKKEILDTVKGTDFNEKGEVVNEMGDIVLTKEELKKYIETGELPKTTEPDTLINKGEQLEDDSLVLKAKENIQEAFGFEIADEFEDTEEGLLALTTKAIELAEEKTLNNFLEYNPVIKDFVNHLKLGGNPNNFNADLIDYDSIRADNLSFDSKLSFIKNKLLAQGIEDADDIINLYKTAGEDKVTEETKKALNYLKEKQSIFSKEKEEQVRQKEQEEQVEIQKYWEDVKSKVTKGQIKDINIPIAERNKFFDYLSKPVIGNKSQEMLDAENEGLDFDLQVSYLRYKKGDISKLLTNTSAHNKVQTLRQKMSNISLKGNQEIKPLGDSGGNIDINRFLNN